MPLLTYSTPTNPAEVDADARPCVFATSAVVIGKGIFTSFSLSIHSQRCKPASSAFREGRIGWELSKYRPGNRKQGGKVKEEEGSCQNIGLVHSGG